MARGGGAHLQLDGSRDDHALPQVSNSEHEGGTAISRSNDGIPGEDERLGAAVGLGRLHEHAAQHHGIDDQTHDVLDDQHGDGQRALLRHHPPTKADGHLQQAAKFNEAKTGKNHLDPSAQLEFSPTWTSMEKRKAEVKEWMAVTQGTGPGSLLGSRGSRSPWAKANNHQIIAKSIQEQRKAEVKMRKECCHFRSTMVVKTSCRNRP